ncbi:ATP/GTP-binding protein, partial [Rhizobium leguminosarum]
TTVRTEPKLTEKMISPRFVSQTMRAQPTAVYAEGFNVKTSSVDPARFSGTAVNFMEVRKFNTN